MEEKILLDKGFLWGITIRFKLEDFWIGVYFDTRRHTFYICPLPMCVIRIELQTFRVRF